MTTKLDDESREHLQSLMPAMFRVDKVSSKHVLKVGRCWEIWVSHDLGGIYALFDENPVKWSQDTVQDFIEHVQLHRSDKLKSGRSPCSET